MRLAPRTVAVAVVALLLMMIAAALSANAGTTTPRKVRAYFITGETGQSVPLPDHQGTEVIRLENLRPGHYLFSSAVNVRGGGQGVEGMYIGCAILGEGIFASGQVRFADSISQDQMPLEGAGTLTEPGEISVECNPGGGLGNASATVHGLTALRVPVLDEQTP